MDGLIIKHKWLDLILKGQKTIEVRGSDTKKLFGLVRRKRKSLC